MATRAISVKDLGKFPAKVVRNYKNAMVGAIRQSVRERGPRLVGEMIRATTPRPPFDRGTYANSWLVVDVKDGARLYSSDPKAAVIENGRRPGTGVGRDGIQAIKGWVHRHNLVDKTKLSVTHARRQDTFMAFLAVMKASPKKPGKDVVSAAELRLAFAIAANIKKRGMPAKKVLARASVVLLDYVIREARLAVLRAEGPI